MNNDYVIHLTGLDRSHGLHALSRLWQHVKLSDVSLRTLLFTDKEIENTLKSLKKGKNLELITSQVTS